MGNHFRGFDFGGSLDDIIQVAREFGEKMKEMGPEMGPFFDRYREHGFGCQSEYNGFHFYPPVNVYTASDGSMVLEFALVGIDENEVSVTFQGDNLILSAKAASKAEEAGKENFARRGFRPRNIERQKYRVPAEDFAQELAKAAFKNGVLTVTVPPKIREDEGIKIEIVKEGN